MSFEILSKAISESRFQDLLKAFNFNEVYRHSGDGDGRHREYIIGFESSVCKMMIIYSSGGSISLNIGTINHDYLVLDSPTKSWVDAKQLLAYIQKKSWEFQFSKHRMLVDVFREYLNDVVDEFRKYDKEIFSMFSSQRVFEQWFQEMREYINSDLHRRYGV